MSPSVRGTSGPAPDDGPPMVHPYTGEVLDPDNVPDETRIAFLEVAQRDLQDAVGELLDKLAADAKGGRPSRWSWQHADRQLREQMWKELVAFVDWLIDRYRPTGEVTIRPCWYRHPVAVEELWALMVAWRAAYCASNRLSDQLAAWHQHWLWPCLQRLGAYASWRGCGSGHQNPTGVTPGPTDAGFAEYVHTPAALERGPGDPASSPADGGDSPTREPRGS